MQKSTEKIVVIDDEPDVTQAVRLTIQLQEPTWETIEANSGEQGLLLVDTESPDLVLLDLRMPDLSGFEVLEQIRLFSDVPVIILSVQDDELDKVRGLQLGADDYIVKPFGHLELLARIRSVFRRIEGPVQRIEKPLVAGDLRIDFNHHRVTVRGNEVKLTKTEYRLLELLANNSGLLVPTETLLTRIWGRYALDSSEYLKVYIHRLRTKLEEDPAHPRYVQTVRGEGYMLNTLA